MADDKSAKSGAAAVSAEALQKLLDALAPEPKEEEPAPPTRVVDELYGAISLADVTAFSAQARTAVERYRNSVRWLVGAVAGIGVALFGSTAFTEQDLMADWRWVGLVVASVGLVLILWAATLVFEPEDASLGELDADLQRYGWNKRRSKFERFCLKFTPRKAAAVHLGKMIQGPEHAAHLGHATVKELIDSIGDAIKQDAPRKSHALAVTKARRALADNVEQRKVNAADLAAISTIESAKNPVPDATVSPIVQLLIEQERLRGESETLLGELSDRLGEIEASDYQLGLDLLHRDLVLSESAVAQLRGKFVLSRAILLIGAVITLAGTISYVVGLKQTSEPAPRYLRSGTLTIAKDSSLANELPGMCLGVPLPITLFDKDVPEPDEDYSVTVADPAECGVVEIPGGRDDVTLELDPAVRLPD